MAAATMPEDEARALCARPKSGEPPDDWVQRRNHFGEVESVFGVVCNPSFRGMHVEIRAGSGRRVVRRDLDLALWYQDGRIQRRVYQLTINDGGSFEHMEEDGTVYTGSHEHFGIRTFPLDHMNGTPFAAALAHFCTQTILTLQGRIEDPFAFNLRG